MTAEQAVAQYYDAWRTRRGDMRGVPLADDFRFTGPVASFDSAEGFREMARQAGQAVTSFEVRRQFVDGTTVCSIIDWEMAMPGLGRMTAAELLEVQDAVIVRGELIYDAEALRRGHGGRGRMTSEAQLLSRAQSGDEVAFEALTESVRGELQVHCYRIVGSVQDAEDLVQETLLAAWRGLAGFQGRASLRSWLYRIATNRCLNHLRDRGRRLPEPPEPVEPVPGPPEPTRVREPVWLEPYPDALPEPIADRGQEPDARYEQREAIGLAFMVALQRLPPRQRAVLVLRDVLGFRAAEVAEMLEATEVAVNRLLHRARQAMDRDAPPGTVAAAPLPDSPGERALVARFATAFQSGDVPGVIALLTDDALMTMPPEAAEYVGPAAIGRFLSTVPASGALERFRLVPTRANGQPAFGCYLKDPHTPIAHAYGLMVLTLRGDRVAGVAGFADTAVFASFGLPRTLKE